MARERSIVRESYTERESYKGREIPFPFLKHSNYDVNVWGNKVGYRQSAGNYRPLVQTRNGGGDQYNKGLTSFYFTNFLEGFGNEDMWKVFIKWGRVREVYIPPKRDKFGKRFGFVRYMDVQNPKGLEVKLDNIWIGDLKIRVSIPRFEHNTIKQ